MTSILIASIQDNENVHILGQKFSTTEDLREFLKTVVKNDPEVILSIEPLSYDYYQPIGHLLYASGSAGIEQDKLRFKMTDGEFLSAKEFKEKYRK